MQNWRDYRDYRKVKNTDGSYTYIIKVEGENVEVSQVIYREYAKYARKMEYMECDLKRDRVLQDESGRAVMDEKGSHITLPEREVSLDKLTNEDWEFPASEPLPEVVVMKRLEMKELHRCLDLLDDDERELIEALFFKGLSEQAYAEILGVRKQSVNERKCRILKKLKIF